MSGKHIYLPCMVGDTVYVGWGDNCNEYMESVVKKIEIDENGSPKFWIPAYRTSHSACWYGVNDIGKGFVLTREEAEAALKEEHDG